MPIPPEGSEIPSLVIAGILVVVAGWVYVRLANGMQSSGQDRMRIPVLFYTIVISMMLFSALLSLFRPEWHSLPAFLVSSGALLFLLSDIMNAWARFVGPIPNHRVWIMSTYHLAQIAITVGAALHFSQMAVNFIPGL
jgi:alkenylglycerophosphocholine hydrolase